MSLTDNQRKIRARRITATRASNIHNGRWRSVVQELQGKAPPFHGNEFTRRGQRNEPNVIKDVCEHFNLDELTLLPVATFISQEFVHEGFRWAAATPDMLWYDDQGGLCMAEIKTTNPKKFIECWGDEQWGIDPIYVGQLLFQSRILNLSSAYAVVSCGTALKVIECPRVPSKEDELLRTCYRLWHKFVWLGEPLPEKELRNGEQAKVRRR